MVSSSSRLCTCPSHLNLFCLWTFAIRYMGAHFHLHFSHDIVLYCLVLDCLLHTETCAFQLCAISSERSFFQTAQHSAPYMIAGFSRLVRFVCFNVVGMFRSHITPAVLFHFYQISVIIMFLHLSLLLPWYQTMSPAI